MEIKCTSSKTFELTEGSEKLGQVTYDSMISFKACATIGNDHYQLTPAGIFSTLISVTLHDMELASLKMNFKGHVIISFQNGQDFILKPTGPLMTKYALEDKNQQKLMLLHPDVNWAKLGYNYSISYDHQPQDLLLVLLATYAANYYIASMSYLL